MLHYRIPCRTRCALSVRMRPYMLSRRPPVWRPTRILRPARNARESAKTTIVENEVEVRDEEKTRRRSISPKSRMRAVAEKVSAARELARRLTEEKEASMKMGEAYSEQMLKSTETAATEAAIEAAGADSLTRAIRLADLGKQKDAELSFLKKLNKALTTMVLDVARDKNEAQKRLSELIEEYKGTAEALSESEETAILEEVIEREIVIPIPPREEVKSQILGLFWMPCQAEVIEKVDVLIQEAKEALRSSKAYFTLPGKPRVGKRLRFFYNRLGGPLPETHSLSIKYGLNRWETISAAKMQKSEGLREVEGDWWETELELESLLYRFDFVIVDDASGLVDNNETKDFRLEIEGALTKGQLLEKRLVLFDEMERKRNRSFEEEILNLRKNAEARAEEAAKKARAKTEIDWEAELALKVEEAVGERRAQAIKALGSHEIVKGPQVGWFGDLRPGKTVLLAYNTATGPLQTANSVRVHLGTDNWYEGEIKIFELMPLADSKLKRHKIEEECGAGMWWGIDITIPEYAAVLNYVFDDGTSNQWDNNNGEDFTTPVTDPLSHEQLIERKKAQLRKELKEDLERRIEGAAAAAKDRIHNRLESRIRKWKSQWQYLYTDPIRVQAGKSVSICYRPDLTVLRGRPETYVRVGFNHWKHSTVVQKLEPMIAYDIGFQRAIIDVPNDAHDMEFVFCDNPEFHGGFVDDNHGFHYRFTIHGSSTPASPLKIVHVTAEMAPIAKVGGLGDVVTALGRAVQEEGHTVEVVMPKYDCIDYEQVSDLNQRHSFNYGGSHIQVWSGEVEGLNVTFIEPDNGFFWVGCIYGGANDAQRFEFFCAAASEYIRIFNVHPDVVHCHDWQTAPVVWSDLAGARTIFTIHNMNYGADLIARAMHSTTLATTVSPTYATEISGMPAIESNFHKLFGILNGIDADIWDPSRDRFLPMNYNADSVVKGKAEVRKELRKHLRLAQIDVPIVGVVTRLTPQKGIHLIKHAAWRTMERGGQFVLLGSAPDPRIQHEFNVLAKDLKSQYPDRAALLFAYDEPLSHLIYAGCDIFLVPSIFEPCGLTQMIAMRYGTVPLVRKTGGLNDTVFDVDTDTERALSRGIETNGFSFEGADEMGMDYALNRALAYFFNDRTAWNELAQRVMRQDWSWGLPALDYLSLYYRALS